MAVTGVAYTEMYVADLQLARAYLAEAIGMQPIAERRCSRQHSVHLDAGGLDLILTAPIGPGPVADFVGTHGDGVADIAFACSDTAAVYDRAAARGGRLLRGDGDALPAVEGVGGVRHTLFPQNTTRRRPPGAWRPLPLRLSGPLASMRLDHVTVCVPSGTMAETESRYRELFGLRRASAEHVRAPSTEVRSVVIGDGRTVAFTLLEPAVRDRPGPIDRFLRANGGAGVQHLTFRIRDVVAAVRAMSLRGVEFLSTPDCYYDALAARLPEFAPQIAALRETGVLADRGAWGRLLRIFTRSATARATLYFELIQRAEHVAARKENTP